MRKLNEIASDLKEILAAEFLTVRISAGRKAEQFRSELEAMHPNRMPGVIIVFDQWNMTDGGTLRECRFSLLLVDRFVAGSDERTLSVLEASERLNTLFPPCGLHRNGVSFFPGGCGLAETDSQYACMAFELIVKQGI